MLDSEPVLNVALLIADDDNELCLVGHIGLLCLLGMNGSVATGKVTDFINTESSGGIPASGSKLLDTFML